jgi:hypothetical protein
MIPTQPPRTAWGKSWNCDLLFQDSGCSCLCSLYDAGWNLMIRTYVLTLGGRRGEKGGLRAILVALSMPSAGLGEPELDAGLGVGVALDA